MSWLPVHVRRDNNNFLHLAERPIAEHLAEELSKLEAQHGEIVYVFHIEASEDHVSALVKIKENKHDSDNLG